jgi:hypothetical protein
MTDQPRRGGANSHHGHQNRVHAIALVGPGSSPDTCDSPFKNRGLYRLRKNLTVGTVLKGHGLSRAAMSLRITANLAAEGWFSSLSAIIPSCSAASSVGPISCRQLLSSCLPLC